MKKIILIAVVLVFASCSNNSGTSTPSNPTIPVDIYVVGEYNQYAAYWKNGVINYLANGNNVTNHGAFARAITFNGNDIYIAGYEFLTGQVFRVKVWKNGSVTNYSNPIDYGFPNAICVLGNDVYVAGYKHLGWGSTPRSAKIWKNGVSTILTDGTKNAEAKSIVAVGNDIYTVGYEGNEGRLWINGVSVAFDTNAVSLSTIKVVGNDVYIAGYKNNGTVNVATVWKNGVATTSHSTSNPIVYNFAIVGNDIYEAGYETDISGRRIAKIWKNSIEIPMYNNGSEYIAFDVIVIETDIYTAGYNFDINNVGLTKIWKNGIDLNINTNYISSSFLNPMVLKAN